MFRDSSPVLVKLIVRVTVLLLLLAGYSWAASYKVLYDFDSKSVTPSSGLLTDAEGNGYGVTSGGSGTVYRLSRTTGYSLLYAFSESGPGGKHPSGNLVFDSTGNLYGTTTEGGNKSACDGLGCGVVFELSPPANGVGLWTETVLYTFCSQPNCADGSNPHAGLIFDSVGNLYGTTEMGGGTQDFCGGGCGTVFELTPLQSGWSQSVLHAFDAESYPLGGVVIDSNGNLYGTASEGGPGNGGAVFELSQQDGQWNETILHNFDGLNGSTDGSIPEAGLVFDKDENLYGTTAIGGKFGSGGDSGFGTVFELSQSSGSWTLTILYSFAGGMDGALPESSLVFDSSGSIYGTTFAGGSTNGCSGNGCGTVFKLTSVEDQWTETLFRFPANGYLGMQPSAPLTIDSSGTLYGTTTEGSENRHFNGGVMFRIMQ